MKNQTSNVSPTLPCTCSNCIFVRSLLIQQMIRKGLLTEFYSQSQVFSVKIKHLTNLYEITSTILQVSIHDRRNPRIPCVQLIVKMSKQKRNMYQDKPVVDNFINEVMFYDTFRGMFTKNILAKCYMTNINWTNLQPPIIVLEDLLSCGFKKFECKLDEQDLKICLKGLAWFHANGIRLINDEIDVIEDYIVEAPISVDEKIIEDEVISAFLDDAIFNALNSDLREKIKLKLEKVNQMDQAAITCFVHGAFTRSKVLYKENGSDNYIRLIDLENVSVHSPVIDVGPILLTNLPTINNVSTLERFLKEMIHYYITMASNEYPFLNAVLLKTEIIDYLLFSYLNLNATEMEDIKHHISLLNALENLGSFNI